MSATYMIVRGRDIAALIYEELLARRRSAGAPARLGILVTGTNAVIESFVHIKTRAADLLGVELSRTDFGDHASTEDLITAIKELDATCDGIIVQLPLPETVDTDAVLAAIPREKDIDALNPHVTFRQQLVPAPVARAVLAVLQYIHVEPQGKHVAVVGAGRLVGAPSAALLAQMGAHVQTVTLESGSLDALKQAEVIVSGAGSPGLITPELVRDGVVLIDAGTSEMSGKVVGDVDPACAEKAAYMTPVPGGIGPIAIAMIFKNLFELIDLQEKE